MRGRRADGYHLLQTVFRFIDLCDTLHVETRADGVISRATDLPGVPEDQDLTARRARAATRHRHAPGAQISLESASRRAVAWAAAPATRPPR